MDYQKALKKLILFFRSNQAPFNGQDLKKKQKGPGTRDQPLFMLERKFRKISLLVIYHLTKLNDLIYSGF